MIRTLLLALLLCLIFSFITGLITIPLLRKFKVGQTVLKYVTVHQNKNGTPTMGGLFFILPSIIIFFVLFGFENRIATVCVVIGLAYLIVGFIDDFIKIKSNKNEGLKPYQKIIFQLAIAVLSGIFCYKNSITYLYLPFVKKTIDVGVFIIPFSAFIFLAITNSVNLTDGLDGLASSVSVVYLFFIASLIYVETKTFSKLYVLDSEYQSLMGLGFSLIGGNLAFLLFNQPKARVFMGDTGSLSLGGFLGVISIFSSNSLFIPLLGVVFVLSSVSVIIQVVYFKLTNGKRVFLMSPFHHHLQLKGFSESQISYYYSIVTCIMGVLLIIFYL